MKKVIVSYHMILCCHQIVEVPDEFEFKSSEPNSMLDELESEIGMFEPSEVDVTGEDVSDVEFDFVHNVDFYFN
jgi:hypothetical protein